MAIATNRRIGRIPHLPVFLAEHPRAIAGWGRKRSGRRAVALARWLGRPHVLLEDGFLRSVAQDGPLLSMIVDDLGTYYDATAPSRMETAIAGGASEAEGARARALVSQWRAARLSKYNHCPEYAGALPAAYVLVVDQCHGDLSVASGLATAASFATMLEAALAENPDVPVLVKVHPQVLAGRIRGYFDAGRLDHPRIRVIGGACHPLRLIENARAVYTVTSLIGFEALLRAKPVRCFGMPFYAGWGLTADALPAPARRRGGASLEALVHAALVALPRYVDPASGTATPPEAAITAAGAARAALFPGGTALAEATT